MTEVVSVLGAGGTMGLPMARNLARAGMEVRAWNRSRAKAEPLRGDGVTIHDSPGGAADGATVILTMLADTDAVLASTSGALSRAGESAVWLQMSTLGIEGTGRCAELARERGVVFVDAPVVGTKAPAEQAQLVVLASGPDEVRDRLEPIFDAIGKRTLWVGEAGAGSRLKLATNAWILAVVEGVAETVALAEGIGVDPTDVLDALAGGPLDLPYLQMKARAILERDFTPSFRLALAAKDAGLVTDAARASRLELPLLETVHRRMAEGAVEHGDADMAATYLTSAPR